MTGSFLCLMNFGSYVKEQLLFVSRTLYALGSAEPRRNC
jgi:hypothetical protein